MTTPTQDTTTRRGSIHPAGHHEARSARRDDERRGTGAGKAHGIPRWNPEDGDYS